MSAPAQEPRQPRPGSLAEKALLAERLQIEPATLAQLLQCDATHIYAARRRLRRMGHALKRRWPDRRTATTRLDPELAAEIAAALGLTR